MRLFIFLMTILLVVSLNAQSKLVLDLSAIPHQKYEYRYLLPNEVQPQIVYRIDLNEKTLFIEVQTIESDQEFDVDGIIISDLNHQEQLMRLKKSYEMAQEILVLDNSEIPYFLNSISFLEKLSNSNTTYNNWKYKFQVEQPKDRTFQSPFISNLQPGGNPIEFIESIFLNCKEVYVLRQYYSNNKDLYTEITYHPTLGILKETNTNNFGQTVIHLFSIDDQPLDYYIKTICNQKSNPAVTLQVKGSVKPKNEFHIVQKGETLYQIAKRYNLSTSEIIRINELKNSQINIGDVLYLVHFADSLIESNKPLIETHPEIFESPQKSPQGRVGPSNGNALLKRGLPKKYAISNNSLDSKRKVHFVLSGETLYSIARKYQTTVKFLIELNNLNPENPKILPNQKLYIN